MGSRGFFLAYLFDVESWGVLKYCTSSILTLNCFSITQQPSSEAAVFMFIFLDSNAYGPWILYLWLHCSDGGSLIIAMFWHFDWIIQFVGSALDDVLECLGVSQSKVWSPEGTMWMKCKHWSWLEQFEELNTAVYLHKTLSNIHLEKHLFSDKMHLVSCQQASIKA